MVHQQRDSASRWRCTLGRGVDAVPARRAGSFGDRVGEGSTRDRAAGREGSTRTYGGASRRPGDPQPFLGFSRRWRAAGSRGRAVKRGKKRAMANGGSTARRLAAWLGWSAAASCALARSQRRAWDGEREREAARGGAFRRHARRVKITGETHRPLSVAKTRRRHVAFRWTGGCLASWHACARSGN